VNGLIGNDIGSCEIPEYDGWNAGIIQFAKQRWKLGLCLQLDYSSTINMTVNELLS
jgi:hypothetical protein